MIAEQDPDLMVSAWKEAMAFDSRPRLGEIHCPALIIAGSRDALIWARPDDFAQAMERFLDPQAPDRPGAGS